MSEFDQRGTRRESAAASAAFLGNAITRKAREDMQSALYRLWLDCDTPEAREKVWGIATGSEMFWSVMQRYEDSTTVEELANELKEAIA